MKKLMLALLGLGLMIGQAAHASPEQDRKQLLEYYKHRFPELKFGDYVFGALALDRDALEQYNSIMDFPPFESALDKGRKMWETPFRNGNSYAGCFPNSGRNVTGNYPYFDDKLAKVVTFETALNMCRKANGEEEYKYGDRAMMGTLTAYARTLSDGMKMNIKVEGAGAQAAYEDGKRYFYTRRGQLNFSCAICHIDNAGNKIRTEILSPVLGQTTHWPVFRGGDNLFTLQMRYEGCNRQVRAASSPLGGEDYNNLEYFHSYLSNGLPLKASVFRK